MTVVLLARDDEERLVDTLLHLAGGSSSLLREALAEAAGGGIPTVRQITYYILARQGSDDVIRILEQRRQSPA